MPQRPTSDDTLVQLPGGWVVPERFEESLPPLRRSDSYEIGVEMVGGRPYLASARIVIDGPPIPPERVGKLDLAGMIDAAVRQRAIATTPRQKYSLEELHAMGDEQGAEVLLDAIRSGYAEATVAARRARRRRITPELLGQVVELFDSKGIAGVMEELDYSERNARRLLARAREAGLR